MSAPTGHSQDTTCLPGQICGEANLDVQYITGIAQNTATIYVYEDTSTADTFVQYLLDIESQIVNKVVSQSNSISYGGNEYVSYNLSIIYVLYICLLYLSPYFPSLISHSLSVCRMLKC